MSLKFHAALAAVAAAVAIAACGGDDDEAVTIVSHGTVITDVHVVSTRDGTVSPHRSVVIDGGRIVGIDASHRVRVEGPAQQIDGTGKYLVPGYADMHTHAMAAADASPSFWPLMIANGITSFREMAGSAAVIARGRKLNQDAAAGLVIAPELLIVPGAIVATPMATVAVQGVRQSKADGADFVKTTTQSPESFAALMAEATAQGLPVAGHLSATVSATDASNAGMRAIEHFGPALSIPMDCSTDAEAIRADYRLLRPAGPPNVTSPFLTRVPEAPFMQRVIDTYDEAKCTALARTFVKNQTWQALTFFRVRTMEFSTDPAYRTDPNLRYVEPGRAAQWQALADQYLATIPASADATFKRFYDLQVRVLRLFRAEGVKMLAGSDMTGIWCIPGFSLQQEFALLSSLGFTPLEVLRMATLDAAEFLGRTDSMGAVEEGKNADLVLLDGDPIADAANLGRIRAVFLKGRYQSHEVLQKMLDDSAAGYARQSASHFVGDAAHVD